jgi:hypothetical protein
MSSGRRAREIELLDALDALEPVSVNATVWRAVRDGRDPLLGHPSAGRWDPGQFDVLYTSFDPDGAVSEIHFHLSRQPVFPSKIKFFLHEISVRTSNTLKFADLRELQPLGVDEKEYTRVLHTRTQSIGDAAYFLGFDGIIAPNARWGCLNLTIFTDRVNPGDLEHNNSSPIDWALWKQSMGKERPS